MKPVISARDIESMLREGKDPRALPADAIVTPAARDLLRELDGPAGSSPAAAVSSAAPTRPADPVEALFQSAELAKLKEQMCDVGRRLWHRAYVDGNGGNISFRVAEDLALCTPTLVSKGFMKPEDICMVDLEGRQKAGSKKRTSEILMHLEIMKAQPKARAVVHAHPPYATAFAVAGVEPPTCMIPEIEVFIGKVPIAPYETPGTIDMARKVAALAGTHNTILMANHGVAAWSDSVEDAYFKMEIIEAYCRTVVVASQLGGELKRFSPKHLQDLLNIKQGLGIPDPRFGLRECELCDTNEWRPGGVCVASPGDGGIRPDAQTEQAVQSLTDLIMARLMEASQDGQAKAKNS